MRIAAASCGLDAPTTATGLVFDVQRFCLHDGPGIRTTVFLKGCPLRCSWCHNPEGLGPEPELMFTRALCTGCGACVSACPSGAHSVGGGGHAIDRARCRACGACVSACPGGAMALAGRWMSVQQVLRAALEDRAYYEASGGGVTLSGGEPLAQAEFCLELLRACRDAGLHTALDTALHAPWQTVATLLPVVDLFLADLKHVDSARHRSATGAGNDLILANLRRLARHDAAVVLRVPMIGGFNDSPDDAADIASFVAALGNVRRVELLAHHALGEGKRQALGQDVAGATNSPPSAEAIGRMARALESRGLPVRCAAAQPPRAAGTGACQARLEALRRTKLRHTAVKRQQGPRDVDDWGQVPLEGRALAFTPRTDRSDGRVAGPLGCARNFRAFLNACPTYVDADSSLLGGYYVTFDPYVAGWDAQGLWGHLAAEQDKYGIVHGIGATQHFLPDVEVGLGLGFGGLLAKIDRYRAVNRGAQQQEYYHALTEFVRGVQEWIARHGADACAAAAGETDAARRANLLEMAELNKRLVAAPPATFREACQWLAWYQMAKRAYIGGGSIGRIDRLLHPYYVRDRQAGRLGDEEATLHLACFLLKDSSYVQVGGVDEQGRDVCNPVSLLVLEAASRVAIPANIAVMVHDAMDPALMRRAVELLLAGRMGIPRFAGLEAVVDGFVRRGFPLEAARQRVQAGCHWFCLPGREYSFCDVIKINFAKVLLAALDELLPDAASASVQRLWELFVRHLRRAVAVTAEGIDIHMAHQHRLYPELALSLLCHGPIEKGVDASHGSLEFTNIGVDGAALATAADSLAAIEQRVQREGAVSWAQLHRCLRDNWAGQDSARRLMRTVGGFGRGATPGLQWAQRISREFAEMVTASPTPAGHRMSPGLFSWASTVSMGRQTGATPDGRGAGEPISFGANPNPGRLHGGAMSPTAVSSAVAAVQCGYGNPAPLQLDVDIASGIDDEAVAKFEALIRTHFRLGGTLINANVLDKQTIEDACRHPENHGDLIVRVTGFSAYFASLSDDFRRLVCERIVGEQ
jgi:formate C-acetyltransferase